MCYTMPLHTICQFEENLQLGSIVLNYTVFINLEKLGDPLGIFLILTRSRQIEEIFGFDNNFHTKDYVFPSNIPSTYTATDNIATFDESILLTGEFPDSLFILPSAHDIANIDFGLTVVVVGSISSNFFEDDIVVFVTVTRDPPPGKRKFYFHIDTSLLFC